MSLQYQVTSEGQVVNVRTLDGSSYQLKSEQVSQMPTLKGKRTRWTDLKKAVSQQNLNEIMKYTGFTDSTELKRAANVLSRAKNDKPFQELLKGTKLTVSASHKELALYVIRVSQ